MMLKQQKEPHCISCPTERRTIEYSHMLLKESSVLNSKCKLVSRFVSVGGL